jgi:hypothetical protein
MWAYPKLYHAGTGYLKIKDLKGTGAWRYENGASFENFRIDFVFYIDLSFEPLFDKNDPPHFASVEEGGFKLETEFE